MSDVDIGSRTSDIGHLFRVGIAWQGSPTFRGDRERSVPLAQFAPLARVPGVQLISLQKGNGTEQLADVSSQFSVRDMGDNLDAIGGAFMDTAAIMMNLDLVISSDTAIAHLAGALGVAVWVALPLVPDWRWQLERADNPWYPSMRLFRQTRLGFWDDVFEPPSRANSTNHRRNFLAFTIGSPSVTLVAIYGCGDNWLGSSKPWRASDKMVLSPDVN